MSNFSCFNKIFQIRGTDPETVNDTIRRTTRENFWWVITQHNEVEFIYRDLSRELIESMHGDDTW